MKSDLFNNLNSKQLEAVKYNNGPSIILAGAGSGKTRVLVQKVLHLILNSGVSAGSIVMITFTNKAAKEMKSRIEKFTGQKIGKLGYVGTFHSFCSMLLRRDGVQEGVDHNFLIYNTDDQEDLLKPILKNLGTKKYTPSYFLNRISDAKNRLITPDKYINYYSYHGAAQVADVYYQYQKQLTKNRALDFDDLIMKTVQLLTNNRPVLEKYQEKYRYLLVDEFQDTNFAQYALTRLLGQKQQNVTVVGDFSQSIYSWRGADIRNLEKFSGDFPKAKMINLEENYRSTQTILDFAFQVISKNELHPVLELFTNNLPGDEVIYYTAENEEEEALYVANKIEELEARAGSYATIAVLYRTNAQSRVIEEAFLHIGIPYTLIGGIRFYERREIKDVLSYLRLFVNPHDTVATERVKKLGKRRWQQFKALYDEIHQNASTLTTVELMDKVFLQTGYLDTYNADIPEDYTRLENIKELKSVAINFFSLPEFLEQVALVESEYFEGEKKNKEDSVRLMTLHACKGLEFEDVFIVGVEEGILPHSRSSEDIYQLEEERRLFYVGITRAKKRLYITNARRRFIFGRRYESARARFLESDQPDPTESW